jgi:hypothetical protein
VRCPAGPASVAGSRPPSLQSAARELGAAVYYPAGFEIESDMNKTGEIVLTSGREIGLILLNQSFTYHGLLEGAPTARMNQEIIERAVQEKRNKQHGRAPYLIPPAQTPITFPGSTRYPFGEPIRIPGILCVARYNSRLPVHDHSDPIMYYSQLSVIWFQEDFAFPIEDAVLAALREIDWEKLAYDVER